MKNGAIDFIEYMPPKLYVESLDTASIPFLKKTSYIYPVYSYIGWNAARPVFSGTKRTRQALSHLVDRDRLIKSVHARFCATYKFPLSFHRPEFNKDLPVYDYNPEKAKKLLQSRMGDSNNNGILDKMVNGKKVEFNFTFMVNQGNEMRQSRNPIA